MLLQSINTVPGWVLFSFSIAPVYAMIYKAMLFTKAALFHREWALETPPTPRYSADAPGVARRNGRGNIEGVDYGVGMAYEIFHSKHHRAVAATQTYLAGVPVVTEGETGNEIFFVVDGAVESSNNGQSLWTMGKGTFFGGRSLIVEEPPLDSRHHSAVTGGFPGRGG
ncbi:cyclic nucleotide-binding domain-containing protein [Mycobacterium ostraviense]|uniref:Cyclic nucleotide-binding domain-containing protein n=1 Tax=Mycobacterium ostraviense TaxID=2738409 RepID=A0A162DVP3_9MYCO|nr:cyclic nucleotide-binding domain-containing protein [Mycobacterium ostraviense]KZS59028.1 hypothetical protein A4G28_15295 [Mycobacterium ostraviense]UGT91257.1 cyclic nucleotide-binding domain-containing protein [Mycobacterium ostraviense]